MTGRPSRSRVRSKWSCTSVSSAHSRSGSIRNPSQTGLFRPSWCFHTSLIQPHPFPFPLRALPSEAKVTRGDSPVSSEYSAKIFLAGPFGGGYSFHDIGLHLHIRHA